MDLYSYRQGGHGMEKSVNAAANANAGESVKVTKYSVRYMRQSKGVAIIWGIFSFCSAILNIVVFLSEEWVGATENSKSGGHFGLWKFCNFLSG